MGERRHVFEVRPVEATDREIGTWLWAMDEARRGLHRAVQGVQQDLLDWRGPGGRDNSIGSLLTHVAGVEMGWCYFDVFGEDFPPELTRLFPFHHDREPDGTLVHVEGLDLETHLDRLAAVRSNVFGRLGSMKAEEWHRLREPAGEDYAMTPAWTVYHLVEHEAGHLFEIRAMKRRWRQEQDAADPD